MMKPRGKIAALATGAGCIALALFFWQDLAVEYHVVRLRRDPEYFRKLTLEPEGAISRRALIRYIRTEPGKRRLIEEYIRPLVEQIERREGSNKLLHNRTAVFAVIEGSFQWDTYRHFFTQTGAFGKTATPKLLISLHVLLPHLSGETAILDGYPEHRFSILPIWEIDRKTRSTFMPNGKVPRDEVGVLMEHRVMLLELAERTAGDWECVGLDGKGPIFFGSIRFLKGGRYRASKIRRSSNPKTASLEAETSTWEESVHDGIYRLEGDILSFSFASGRIENYRVEFDRSDTLILRADGGKTHFRRTSDVPPGQGNKIGIAALKGPKD